MRSIFLIRVAVVCASALAATFAAHFAALNWIERGRISHIDELNDVALRRSESTIAAGFGVINDLLKHTSVSCEPDALQAIRLGIYQRSAVKDVRVADHDGSVRCSAYSETLEFDLSWPKRSEMAPGVTPGTNLFRVEQFSSIALGLMQDYTPKSALAAILSISATTFDIMPTELLGHSEVALRLTNGERLTGYPSDAPREFGETVQFVRTSAAYPIKTIIRVDKAAYEQWNREDYPLILAFGAMLGLVSGALLASLMGRPQNQLSEMDRALAAKEFKPYCQPIFDLNSGVIIGCEILVRWIKENSVIPPSRFIELAESSGRIERMTWQMLEPALRELQPVTQERENFKISFNVTPGLLISPHFPENLDRFVRTAGVNARNVVVEITERDELEDPALASETVARLRQLDFRVAIDDVGIGHSGLSQIQQLDADIMKIDKFFVDLVTRDATATAVIEMLVKLAKELKMAVVAEGIETIEQVSALISCGVTQGQGYIVSPPVPTRKFLELLMRSPQAPAFSLPTPKREIAAVA